MKRNPLLPLLFIFLTSNTVYSQTRVPQIADPKLNDIAIVQDDPEHGAVIYFNPMICQHIGAACHFFIQHEYGHIQFEHQRMEGNYPADREQQADCWAASTANPYAIHAAYQLFLSGRSSANWEVYGSPQERAARVRECAIEADNWIGS